MSKYSDRTYQNKRAALRRQARKNDLPCTICGHKIDYDLAWPHPMSFSADHVQPISKGGRLYGDLTPVHMACNSRRGNRELGALKQIKKPKTSRDW